MSRSGTNSLRYNQIRANNLKVKGENMTTSGPVKTNQRNKIQQCRQFYLFNVLGDAKSTQRLYINDRSLSADNGALISSSCDLKLLQYLYILSRFTVSL